MKKLNLTIIAIAMFTTLAFCQNPDKTENAANKNKLPDYKFSVSTTWLSFANFGEEETNTHHYELHVKYNLSPKDKIGIKAATWKLFAPMGMPLKEQLKFDEANFYPGRLREGGLGVTYQRFLWKGLFATAEIMPMFKTYFDENENEIENGFKLYTTWHLGYHIPLFKNRFYIEPQVHCNYWPVDSEGPQGFEEKESKWNNYFFFEPNLYIGVKF
ncbi:MAG: hypothetical protein U0W24_12345 [Bacteroidales bacterium]